MAFCAPCLPFAALGLPLIAFLPEYYATVLGMGSLASFIFIAVRLCDIFVDPPLGTLMDKTHSRWGRFKLWMLISVPILILCTWMVFMAGPGTSPFSLGIWLLGLYVGFSIAALSHSGWGSVLSDDYNERTRIFAVWQVGNIAGIILVSLIPVYVQSLLHKSYSDAIRMVGMVICILLPVMTGLAYWLVPERQSSAAHHRIRLVDYFAMWRRRNVRCVLWADLFLGLAPGVMSALFYYYFMQAKGLSRPEASNAIAIYFLSGIIGAPVWNWASTRFGKHRTLNFSSGIFALAYLSMAFMPRERALIAYVMTAAAGIPYAASLLLTRALMADVGDEVQYETGKDHKGALMAILSATTKLGYAISLLIVPVLEWGGGFEVQAIHNTPGAIIWVEATFVGLPVLCLIAAILAMRAYDLTSERHAALMDSAKMKEIKT